MTDRLERLTNLLANLLEARRPLTLEEIVETVPGYPEEPESRRKQFQRDRDVLRGIGIPVATVPLDPLGGGDHVGYRVRPEDYYLPDPDLTPDERAALHVAVTAVSLGDDAGRIGLHKLGGLEGESAAPLVALPEVPALPALFEAYRRRASVTFTYRDERRTVDPYALLLRRGHWYVAGHDHDRGERRSFRVDRITGEVTAGDADGFLLPPDVDPNDLVNLDPLTYGDEAPLEARVLVDRGYHALVVHEMGSERAVERRADGSVVISVPVTNVPAFRAWLFDLLEHAEVLEPPTLRTDVIHWLETIVGGRP